MSLTGSLTDFPLIEILQLIEKGKKTGSLTLFAEPVSKATPLPACYIWVYRGRLVAVAKQLDNRGLVQIINQRQWASPRVVAKLAQLCPTDKPLGLHLKNLGVLRASQLKQLFFLQVLQPVSVLSQLQEGQFRFDQTVLLPMREMTGLSISAGAVKLFAPPTDTQALRFEDWKPNLAPTNIAVHSPYSDNIKNPCTVKGIQKNKLELIFA
jgi:hypothetical protein